MRTLFFVLVAATTAAAQVRLDHARVERHGAAAGLERTFRSIVSGAPTGADPFWIGYTVPVVEGDRVMCCWSSSNTTWIDGTVFVRGGDGCCGTCGLESGRGEHVTISDAGAAPFRPAEATAVALESSLLVVMYRVAGGRVERVRVFSEQCALDAGNRVVHWLDDVKPAESVALLASFAAEDNRRVTDAAVTAIALHADASADGALETLVGRDRPEAVRKKAAFWMAQARGRRGFEAVRRLAADDPSAAFRKSAVFALSQSQEPDAIPTLIAMAKKDASPQIRGEAIFWLAQAAGRQASAAITDAIENDPETEVKKKAVFALSQLPKDEGVPLLIQIARTNRNAVVRKQAMFWLGQSRDPRALAFFEEVLR